MGFCLQRKVKHIALLWTMLMVSWIVKYSVGSHSKNPSIALHPCDKSRRVFTESWGIITDGPLGSNYTQDSHCEWLIKANDSSQFITLTFQSMGTECSYDYVFVYDGSSYDAPLLGSFSGKTQPQNITATSGTMLILLYSDTNYVLDGFRAEYSITDCPGNCTNRKHGTCFGHTCVCEEGWGGKDCGRALCPENCGSQLGRGSCRKERCECSSGYSGKACSLHNTDNVGNRWHWIADSSSGFSPRAAHTAVYEKTTDSLYVFGGYNLNKILGDLAIYQFQTSHWEEEQGNHLDETVPVIVPLGPQLTDALQGTRFKESISQSSFLWHLISVLTNNSTTNMQGSDLNQANRLGRSTKFKRSEDPDEEAWIANAEEPEIKGTVVQIQDRIPEIDTELEEQKEPENKVDTPDDLSGFKEDELVEEGEQWKKETIEIPVAPAARYGHAACSYPGGFVMFGGKTYNGKFSNELWYYNATSRSWSLRAVSSILRPPGLTRHTLTLGDGDRLYVFGGSLENGEFSSQLYRIDLNFTYPLHEQWKEIHPRGGKNLDVRVVAHTTVYYPQMNSLFVYGGIMAGVARFSKLTDRMFSFQLNDLLWSEIHYPRAHLRDTYIPRERAFHTSTVIGNYMIVFGGYSHRHNKEEICYDNQMYLYHLGCHIWISHDILGNSDKDFLYPKQQGVFAHATTVRNGNTLLIVGGYHGNVNGDLLAYTLPPMLASREGESFDPEQVCNRHHSLMECTANPECGWCSADEICYGRTVGSNCTTNLQTTRCPGVCPALGDCHSCLIHGNVATVRSPLATSVAYKLHLSQCTWCVQNARCHHRDDNFGVCGLREDTHSQVPGWWGAKGTEVSNVNDCRVLDRRPGLTFLKYRHPANWSQPDSVSIINATTVDFNMLIPNTRTEQSLGGDITARLLGFLRPPDTWNTGKETLRICASFSSAILNMSHDEAYNEMEVTANLTATNQQCIPAQWKSGNAVTLLPGRYLVDFISSTTLTHGSDTAHQLSKMELLHNKSEENSKAQVFTFEYLEPYENNGSCMLYTNCLLCLTDSSCGWCDLKNMCMPRYVNEMEACTTEPDEFGYYEWKYLNLVPSNCENCSNYISCESCVSSNLCEWWVEDMRCSRIGRLSDGIKNTAQCPISCHERKNCSACLGDRGRCVWCEATQECFSFHVYTSEYQFGTCREWVDQTYFSSGHVSQQSRGGGKLGFISPTEQCRTCSAHTNCSSCMHDLGCGWCYNVDSPIDGICIEGDFTKPRIGSCSAVFTPQNNSAMDWAYAQCPDVDECELHLHDCHPNATCSNTHGSYSCQCKNGFTGDGKITCTRTCNYTCNHGYCLGAPTYSCKCDLGWTGEDCSINCGCNNHSTCTKGVGICDECEDWTTGEFCEQCKPGSYGNATDKGCEGCNCNEHGNETLGICDLQTGVCFCKDNTEGENCDRCKKGYYGDPRNGGMCYYQCVSRGILTGIEPQGLGSRFGQLAPWELRAGAEPTRECFWIVNPHNVNKSAPHESVLSSVIQFTIHRDINVTCGENSVYVYDGLPPFITGGTHQNHVLGVFCTTDSKYPITVEAKSGILSVYYSQADPHEGFNASYTVLTCPDRCGVNRTCRHGQCVCEEGHTGMDCSVVMCQNNCSVDLKQGMCDKGYGRCLCAPGFGGSDCSVVLEDNQLVFTQLFSSEHLADNLDHLRNQLPRFGHTLVADRRGSLWMFGGLSLSHGPLNDIRLFDTKNSTWMQVTVDSTREANVPWEEPNMPKGRYFHAAEIVHSRAEIYIYGGLTEKDDVIGLSNNTLNDFWKFSLKNQRWIDIENEHKKKPPPLAGHTLTFHHNQEYESLILIGGFSPKHGFLEAVWEFNLETETWNTLNTTGSGPTGVYGHSTVYHAPTQSFYVFGGYAHYINHTYISNTLYAFHYPTHVWSILPTFSEYNPSKLNLPRASFLHSAITTDDYMLIFGGSSYVKNASDSLIVYSYSCNQWIRLISKDVEIVGSPPPTTHAHAMALDMESGAVYVIGGFDGGIKSHVTKIMLPKDLCGLWSGKDKCRTFLGCSYCALLRDQGENSTHCYSNKHEKPQSCSDAAVPGRIITNNGVTCDAKWIAQRRCDQYNSCSECLAKWPSHIGEPPVCKWCNGCPRGRCIPHDSKCEGESKCTGNVRQREISEVVQCPESHCAASDCEKCLELGACMWTSQVLLTQESGVQITSAPIYDWNCVSKYVPMRSSIKVITVPPAPCPLRCSEFQDCRSCLQSQGSEGGWHECRWSVKLRECISPSYQAMYCAGGVCGLVLQRSNIDRCQDRCALHKQCSTCLKHAECGWCSLDDGNNTGDGVCTDGSLKGPPHDTCHFNYMSQTSVQASATSANSSVVITPISWNSSSRKPPFSWNYFTCPAENECLNNHHTCDNKSEECVDLIDGFRCDCGNGYKSEKSMCVPVCSQGCVRGVCVQPNMCRCDFGYVGANCSIQCQCNGHANCEGPDKLDSCLGCHNNTKGKQCEVCEPLFVGDPKNNGQCIPCVDYCNGHTDICADANLTTLPLYSNLTELREILGEGPSGQARCFNCANLTAGSKCDTCEDGHFRGTADFRDSCRPCECHGHGNTCDPKTGEQCDCQHNTESDPTCQSSNSKNSNQQCWKLQCSKCKEFYMGTPIQGHQCYRQMTADSKFCFDAKQLDDCKLKPGILNPGDTVFFVVQPRFMNVDIRIIVDVTQGAVDLFLSPRDDTFVLSSNDTAQVRKVSIDPKYRWHDGEYYDMIEGLPVRINSLELHQNNMHQNVDGNIVNISGGTDGSELYTLMAQDATGLTTFVTLYERNTFLLIRGLKDRLVLTLPQDKHDLGSTKFYLALTAVSTVYENELTSGGSYGMIFFRQDQLHIDLFVFFSVFFSCFFLFLAACVVAWKAKQAADIRRARQRHIVEMMHMANRPFASISVIVDSEKDGTTSSTQSPIRKKRKPWAGEIRPVAVEPTDDGIAGVATIFVSLPGGKQAPVRMALASSLILLSRIYPHNNRAFLRRRSSRAPS